MTRRAVLAEFAGTCLLLYVVVGSGLTLDRLDADPAGGLFFHALAVGLVLAVLIVLFAAVSGAHFNPAVTLAVWRRHGLDSPTAIRYVSAQVAGAVLGVALAHLTFEQGIFSVSTTSRVGWGPMAAEMIGTLVLVLVIVHLVDQDKRSWIGPAVGAWVAVMVFSSSSAGFLNPAVTLARTLTDSYTGIAPSSTPGFIVAQVLGAVLAVVVATRLSPIPEPKGTS